jgi:uncharacterized protein (TIGR02246 family)
MCAKLNRLPSALRLAGVMNMAATITAVSVFIAAFISMTEAQTNEDSAAVLARVGEYQSVWDTHESAALAAFFTKDADMVMGNLPVAHGRQAIQDWWRDYFARQEPERRLTIDVNSIRLLSADVALANVATTTGGRDNQGKKLLSRKARGTWLLHKQQGSWLISAMRGMPTVKDSVVLTASLEAAEVLRPEIRAFVDAYGDAFNSHDPSALTALYRNDADIIVRTSPLIHGSQAIEDWWRAYFSRPRPYRALFIIDEIRMINPDVALLNVVGTGAPEKVESEQAPLRYARGTWVLVREAGDWLIDALWVLPSKDDRIIRRSGH